jgi:hypothetical protein
LCRISLQPDDDDLGLLKDLAKAYGVRPTWQDFVAGDMKDMTAVFFYVV